ncbi:AraC family transcriptional regulator ligand-binding domain-containing protein [Roseobacter sp.]|uniref:AraC family transcriptional regulator n=1 Tax=Roseobacter sp. TaxID=1907202 RepID=UPI00385C6F0B
MPNVQLVPVFWLRHLVAELCEHATLVTSVLQKIGVNETNLKDPGFKVRQDQEAAFLHIMSQAVEQPSFGANVGLRLDIRQTTLLSYLLFNSQTVDHALQNLVRFLPLMRPASKVNIEHVANGKMIRFDNQNREVTTQAQYIEFCVAMLINTLRRASELPISPTAVALVHDRPGGANELSALFGCPVKFNASITTITLNAADLRRPVIHRDPNLYREMLSYGRLLLQNTPRRPASLQEQVGDFVVQHLTRTPPGIEETADALGLSARTLARRLSRQGTSYRALRDSLRISAAKEMLSDTDKPLAEITYLLGYADQSAFGAAFKRAVGQTPKQYRVLQKLAGVVI